jgi:hypothetical protein
MKKISTEGRKIVIEIDLDELDSIGGLLREAIYGIGEEVVLRVGISLEEAKEILKEVREITTSFSE